MCVRSWTEKLDTIMKSVLQQYNDGCRVMPFLHTYKMANSISNEKEDSGQAFESEIDAVAFKKDIDSFAKRVDVHERIRSSRMTEELSLEGERLFKQLDEFYHEVQQKRVLASMLSSIEDLTDDEHEQFVEMLHEKQLAWEMTYGGTHDKTLTIALKKLNKINDAMGMKSETSAIEKHDGPYVPVDFFAMKDSQNECVDEPTTLQDVCGFAMDWVGRGADEIDAICTRGLGMGSEANGVIYRLDLGDRRKFKDDSNLVSIVLETLGLIDEEDFDGNVRRLYRLYSGTGRKGLKELGLDFVSAS